MADFDLLTELSIYSQGRKPQWEIQPSTSDLPSSDTVGVDTSSAIVTNVSILPRSAGLRFSSRVQISVEDLSSTSYTVSIDGNSVVYDAAIELPATSGAILQGLSVALNLDPTISTLIVSTLIDADGDGAIDTILIKNLDDTATHTTNVSTVGSGELTAKQDATSATATLYALGSKYRGVGPSWSKINGASFTIDSEGFTERFNTSGYDRIFVRLQSVSGPSGGNAQDEVQILVGPARDES
jgi:hypothetical protein